MKANIPDATSINNTKGFFGIMNQFCLSCRRMGLVSLPLLLRR
jgi:hypothetical protein